MRRGSRQTLFFGAIAFLVLICAYRLVLNSRGFIHEDDEKKSPPE